MRSSAVVAFLSIGTLIGAIPISDVNVISKRSSTPEVSVISKRDPCDGINARPVLYHEYREDVCPAKNKLNKDGSCPGVSVNTNCASFCQIRTNFLYSQEIPFSNSYCRGPESCSISETHTATYTFSGNINSKWLEAIGLGISGGYSQAQAVAHARSFSISLKEGQCGYFTFVPIRKETCGSVTSAETQVIGNPYGGMPFFLCGKQTTAGNVCAEQPWKNPDGSPDGVTLFVKIDCVTLQPTNMTDQDPVYQKPGVPLDRGVVVNMIQSWNPKPTTTTTAPSPSPTPPEGDTCDVSYKFLFDTVEVRGKSWTTAQLGNNGDNLKSKLSGCGDLTDWNFEMTPNDCCYQWYASARLPIGVKNCVGKAVVAAGGPGANVGNCHGAG